jgi:nucleoid DNA-binding protein
MNNKLLLQDLTDQLAEAGKIKKKDAEEFLRAFFKLTEDALFEDGIVKINGLGTLKLVKVDARKSVNVTTGEEFEIKEHYKVSFVPDAELKTAVNQPYAHLEPVELDPVTDSNPATDKKAPVKNEKTTVVKEKATENKEKTPLTFESTDPVSVKKSPKIKRSTVAWSLFFLLIALFGAWSVISNINHNREEAAKNREIALVDSLEADANLQADLAALDAENDSIDTQKQAADDSLESVIESVASESGGGQDVAKPTTEPSSKPASTPVKPTVTTPKPAEIPVKPTATKAKPAASPVKGTSSPAKPAVDAKKTEPVKPVEYIATVVLKPGDRLNLLALKYYGDKIFWVYIYEANKKVIPDPDNVPVGITVRIPKPDPKRIDPNNEALVAKAKALQLKYIGAQ